MNKLILISLIIFIVPFSLAEILLNPTGFTGEVFVNEPKIATLQVTNNFTFALYNISLTPIEYSTITSIETLNPNETKIINITVKTNETFNTRTFNSVLKAYYNSQINLPAKTWDINITNSSFVPSELHIKIGDSIRFTNLAEIFSTIRDDTPPYHINNQIEPNQSITISNFNTQGDFWYTDLNVFKRGHIYIDNISIELINNPDYNKNFFVTINSKYVSSELGMEIYPFQNISVAYNGVQEISLRIWNKGNQTIHNVNISSNIKSDWFAYESNMFDIYDSQNKFVKVTIHPIINISDDTNKTYSIDFLASATNALTTSTNLKLFIPFTAVLDDANKTREQLMEEVKKLRDTLAKLFLEQPETETKYVYLNSTITYDKEQALQDMADTKRRLSLIETKGEDNTKSMNEMILSIGKLSTIADELKNRVDEYNNISLLAKVTTSDVKTQFYLILVILLLLVFGALLIYYLQYKKKEEMHKVG